MLRIISLLLIAVLAGCQHKTREPEVLKPTPTPVHQEEEKPNFFPVTTYLKGQITALKNSGKNPLLYHINANKTDSVWVKTEEFDKLFQSFLEPVIDSSNQTGLFKETSFLDQTINSITFSYDPKSVLPDSVSLRRWDVYVDPETQKVKRIYLVKKLPSGNLLQLTWQADRWCKMIEINPNKDGNTAIVNQQEVKWDF